LSEMQNILHFEENETTIFPRPRMSVNVRETQNILCDLDARGRGGGAFNSDEVGQGGTKKSVFVGRL